MVVDAESAWGPRRPAPLPACLCAALLPALLLTVPSMREAASGESRAAMAVTARLAHTCSVGAAGAAADARPVTGVDHRCTGSPGAVPYRVSVHALAPATGAVRPAGRRKGTADEALVITVTY